MASPKGKMNQGEAHHIARAAQQAYGTGWKNKTFPVTVPSGATALCRKPSIQKLMGMGLLDNLDMLTSIVNTSTIPVAEGRKKPGTAAQPEPMVNVEELKKDPKKLQDMMDMVDKLVTYIVVEPKLLPAPVKPATKPADSEYTDEEWEDLTDEDFRDEDLFYIDEVDFDDKAFIMNVAIEAPGADLATFRPGSTKDVGNAPAVEAASVPTE